MNGIDMKKAERAVSDTTQNLQRWTDGNLEGTRRQLQRIRAQAFQRLVEIEREQARRRETK